MTDVLGYFQAFAAAAIAVAGVIIAAQQKRLADIRLRNDLFDRRFQVYEAARKCLVSAANKQRYDVDVLFDFARGTNDATFFFTQSIVDYLDEVRENVTGMRVQAALFDDEGRDDALKKAHALQQWCADQIIGKKLLLRFRPEMGLDPKRLRKGAWLWRTPGRPIQYPG